MAYLWSKAFNVVDFVRVPHKKTCSRGYRKIRKTKFYRAEKVNNTFLVIYALADKIKNFLKETIIPKVVLEFDANKNWFKK